MTGLARRCLGFVALLPLLACAAEVTGGPPSGTAGSSGGQLAGTSGAAGTTGVGGTTGAVGTTGAAGSGGRVSLDGRKALFVVDDPSSIDDGDAELKLLLEVRGMVVTFAPFAGPASLATGQHVVLVSSGVSASDFVPIWKDIPQPMIVFGNSAYSNLGWIATSSAKGTVDATVKVALVDAATPLASDLPTGSGFALIAGRDTSLYWGTPAGAPIRVASVMGQPTQLIDFAYEKGAALMTGTAAGRRVAFGFRSNVISNLTIEAFKLFSAGLDWTAGSN
jgi:hypothetical protein